MRFIISGGGTAGHINPAIAIADKLKELDGNSEMVFVGRESGMEGKLVSNAGYPIWNLNVRGLKRSLSPDNLKTAVSTVKAVKEAKKMIESFSPDAVIGTGGYVCFPVLYAASKKGIYTALHESNAVPGLAVRLLKNKVDRVFTGFEGCAKKLGKKALYTGNPLRCGFALHTRESAREMLGMKGKYRYLVLSFGGSLGAKTVNNVALDIMAELTSERSDILHLHSCGKNYGKSFCGELEKRGLDKCKNIRVSEYIYDMPTCICAADAVICRSGAMTLTELSAAGAPAVLIPSPNVTGDHQFKNATEYADTGAAYVVSERELSDLANAVGYVRQIITDKYKREEMSKAALAFAKTDAADKIAREILQLKKR